MKKLLLPILAGVLLLGACGGGDDDSDDSTSNSGSGSPSSATTGAPSSNATRDNDTDKPGATAKLAAGSSATIKEAPDAGTVTMTIVSILSPADSLYAAGLTVPAGEQLWAIEAKVDVKDGKEDVVSNFYVETSKGEYSFTGTGGDKDIGYFFKQGTSDQGYIAFQLPADEEIERVVAEFSIYQGYDIVFEK